MGTETTSASYRRTQNPRATKFFLNYWNSKNWQRAPSTSYTFNTSTRCFFNQKNSTEKFCTEWVLSAPTKCKLFSRILFIKNYILFDCQIVNITIPCTIVTCHNEFYLLIAKSVCYIFNRIFCRITSAIVERSFFLTAYI